MNKIRGFEIVKGFEDKEINLPKRQTKNSAGYDFEASEDVTIPGIVKTVYNLRDYMKNGIEETVSPNQDLEQQLFEKIEEFGQDFEGVEETELTNEFYTRFFDIINDLRDDGDLFIGDVNELIKRIKPVLVPTGVKAYMLDDEKLDLYGRSSNPTKKYLMLSNGVGLIDSDYYENEDNDGHIMFQFINFGFYDYTIKKGERIGQGVFTKFLKIDNEEEITKKRDGGHGSTL